MCQQHIDEHCPAEVMCLRSIRGKQAIKVLLRFTQQLKPKMQVKAECTSTEIHSSIPVSTSLLYTDMDMFYRQEKGQPQTAKAQYRLLMVESEE